MNKHTPGPWRCRGNLIGIIDDSDTQSCGSIKVICEIDEWDFKEQSKANGSLISSAPALLEALKAFVENSSVQCNFPHECEMAEAIIAKAEGAK